MVLLLLFALMLPQDPPAQPDRVDRAVQLIHEEKYEMAYQVLLDVVKDDPTNARAFPFLAAMELQTGRLNDAESHINTLLAHDPENGDMRELSGQLYMARRDWKKAEEQWRSLIAQRPNSEQAHMQLAAVLLQEDRYNDALGEVTRALEITPKRSDARSLRGNILAALGQINQAALDWNIALVGDPDDTVALSGLAVFLRQSDPEQALKYAYRAVELTDWKSLGPMRVLAMVYRARGENELAKKTLERAIMVFPNNAALAADLRGEAAPADGPTKAAAASKTPSNKPAAPAPSVASKPDSRPSAPAGSAPPAKSTTTVAVAPPASKPEPVIPKPPPDAVVIPPLAVGGLTLGAAVGDLLAFDVLPLPPSAKVPQVSDAPPAAPKPVDSGLVAKAVVPSKSPAKPAETSAPPAAKPATVVTPPPVVTPTPTPPPTKVTPPPAITPPAAKPPAPAPTISVEAISPLAFGGLTLGATFGDLIALEKFPAPPPEATTSSPAAAPTAPPAITASSASSQPATPPLAPKPSKNQAKQQPPPLDLHWGMIPLSTISPAFVYGDVPPPVERRP